MAKITYGDKVYLNENADVPAINKVQDTDLNQIKNVINGIDDGSVVVDNLVVDKVGTKNLFDSSTIIQGDITGGYRNIRMSSRQSLWLEAGTYTVSSNLATGYRVGVSVQTEGVPPLSSYPSYVYDSGWQTTLPITFTIANPGYFAMALSRTDNGNFTSTDITNLLGYNYQLEKGSTETTYSSYQNLNVVGSRMITDNGWKVRLYEDGHFEAWYPYTTSSTTTATTKLNSTTNIYLSSSITINAPSIVTSIYDYRVNASFATSTSWAIYWLVNGTFNLRFVIAVDGQISSAATYRKSAYMSGTWK